MSSGKKKTWLFRLYRGLYLPSYMGIIINHCEDPVFIQPGFKQDSKGQGGFLGRGESMDLLGC